MKNLYLTLLFSFLSYQGFSQCGFNIQVDQQPSCDTSCNSYFTITSTSGPGNYYLFVDGNLHSQFTTLTTVGPLCPATTSNIFITDSASVP
jgi:hypothetical protein